jgi:endoglucanase
MWAAATALLASSALPLLLLLVPSASGDLCINLGNVLDAPTEGEWAPPAQEYYFDDYVARRFSLVRIPVRWDEHTGNTTPYTIDPDFLARVHTVVGWALARNLSAIVNSHHDDWLDVAGDGNFSTSLPRFVAIWTQVAASFADAPASQLSFEVFNEPHVMSLANLNALYAAVLPVMRAGGGDNGVRQIYLGGLSWMSAYWIEQNPEAIEWPALAG